MKKRLLPLAILCLTGLVGCSTVQIVGLEEQDQVALYAVAVSLERSPDPIEFDDMPEEVKAVLLPCRSHSPHLVIDR
jgi:hypothetical protein